MPSRRAFCASLRRFCTDEDGKEKILDAEILCVGTELLLGDIVNTNAAYAARKLAEIGVDTHYQVVVGDNADRLKGCLQEAFAKCDTVILTGGLGPTYDDLTKETVAEYFGLEMHEDPEAKNAIDVYFRTVKVPCTPNNNKQALVPDGSTVFLNANGTAPGIAVEKDGKLAILLPGPPKEMEPMFDKQVIPFLLEKEHRTLRSRNIMFFGIGESTLEDGLKEMMLAYTNPTIAPYAKYGEVRVRVTASGADEEECYSLTDPVVRQICEMYPENVYGIDVESLSRAVVAALTERKLHLATAESCTGGLLAKRITDISGASDVFECGVVSYANRIKHDVLGVSQEVLDTVGAVSEDCARQMAEGVRRLGGADYGLSTTGIAGPTGGTPDKPVGTVYIALAGPDGTQVKLLNLSRPGKDSRDRIRHMTAQHAFFLLLQTITGGKLLT